MIRLTAQEKAAWKKKGFIKGHKYGAKPTTVDGIRFHSQAEARRYGELKLLEKAGHIAHLSLQPRFMLLVWDCEKKHDVQIGSYIADFSYWDVRADKNVIEDVKGMKTPLYKLKKQIVEHRLGITITEVA